MVGAAWSGARYDMIPSTAQTASADALVNGEGYFHGVIFTLVSTDVWTVDIYDALTAAGGTKELVPTQTIETTAPTRGTVTISLDPPVAFHTGLSVNVSGGTGSFEFMTYHSFE